MRQFGVASTMILSYIVCLLVLCGSRAEKEVLEDFASLLSDSGLQQEIKKRLSDLSDYPYGSSDSSNDENNIQPDQPEQLVSDPGSGCNYKVEEGKIIRTHDSINNGASYIDSPVDIQNKSQCRSECCKHDECDLAVFKDKGDEHACYLFACGESCLFTNHTGFSTMQKYRKAVQHEKDLENLATDPPSTTSTTASTTTSTTTTTTTLAPTQKKEPASLFGACSHDDDCAGTSTECVSGFCVCSQGYHAQEGFCREECSRFQFECANVGKPLDYPQCIAVYDTCDGITHCQDSSDELKCDSKQGDQIEDINGYAASDADDQSKDGYIASEPRRHPYFDTNFRDRQQANRMNYNYFDSVLAGGGGALDTQGYVDRQQQQAWLLQQQQLQQQQQQQLLNSGYIPAMLSPQQLYGNSQQQAQNPYGYNQQLQQLPQVPQQVLIPVQQGQQQPAGQVPLQQGAPTLPQAGGANTGQGAQQGYLGQPGNLAHDLATLQQPIPVQQEYQQQQHLQQQQQQQQQAVQQQAVQQQAVQQQAVQQQAVQQQAGQQQAVQQQSQQQVLQVPVTQQKAVQPQPPVQVPYHVANSGQNLGRLAGAQAAVAGQRQTDGGVQGQVPVQAQQPQQQKPQMVNQQQLDQGLPQRGRPQHGIPQQGGIRQSGRQQGVPQGGGREVDYPSGRGSYSRVDAVSQQRSQQQTQQQNPSQQLEPSPPIAVHAGHMNRPIPPTDDFHPAATSYPPSARPGDGAGDVQPVRGYGELDRTTGRLLSPPQGQDEGRGRQQPTGQINYSDGGFIVSDSQPSGGNVAGDRTSGRMPLTGDTAGQQEPAGYDVGQTLTGQGRAGLGDLGRGSWPGQAGDAYLKPEQAGVGADSYGGGDRGRPNLAYSGYDTNSYPQSYPGYDQLYAYADPDPAPNTNTHTDYDYQYAAEPSDDNLDELAKLLEEVLHDHDEVTDYKIEDYGDYLANDADDQREDDYVASEPRRHPYFDNNFRDHQQANRMNYNYFDSGSRGGAEPSRGDSTGAEGDGSFWDYYDSSPNYRPWPGSNSKSPIQGASNPGLNRGQGSSLTGLQGTITHGRPRQGAGLQGAGPQGAAPQGAGPQGAGPQGAGMQGAGPQGAGMQGAGPQGAGMQGAGRQGAGRQGAGMQGGGMRGRVQDGGMQSAHGAQLKHTGMGNAQGRPVSRPEVKNPSPDMTKVSPPGGGDLQHPADRPRLRPSSVKNNQYHPALARSTQLPAEPLPAEVTTKTPSQQTTTKAARAVATVTATEQVGTTSLPMSKRKPAISGGVVAGHMADNLLNEAEVERPSKASNRTAVLVLAMGLAVTALLLIFVGCRLRMVKRRLRRGRPLNSNEADYLINGMYL